jgi:hypothetical protein
MATREKEEGRSDIGLKRRWARARRRRRKEGDGSRRRWAAGRETRPGIEGEGCRLGLPRPGWLGGLLPFYFYFKTVLFLFVYLFSKPFLNRF